MRCHNSPEPLPHRTKKIAQPRRLQVIQTVCSRFATISCALQASADRAAEASQAALPLPLDMGAVTTAASISSASHWGAGAAIRAPRFAIRSAQSAHLKGG
jgi:hypothetical protein